MSAVEEPGIALRFADQGVDEVGVVDTVSGDLAPL